MSAFVDLIKKEFVKFKSDNYDLACEEMADVVFYREIYDFLIEKIENFKAFEEQQFQRKCINARESQEAYELKNSLTLFKKLPFFRTTFEKTVFL